MISVPREGIREAPEPLLPQITILCASRVVHPGLGRWLVFVCVCVCVFECVQMPRKSEGCKNPWS